MCSFVIAIHFLRHRNIIYKSKIMQGVATIFCPSVTHSGMQLVCKLGMSVCATNSHKDVLYSLGFMLHKPNRIMFMKTHSEMKVWVLKMPQCSCFNVWSLQMQANLATSMKPVYYATVYMVVAILVCSGNNNNRRSWGILKSNKFCLAHDFLARQTGLQSGKALVK